MDVVVAVVVGVLEEGRRKRGRRGVVGIVVAVVIGVEM